MSWTWRYEKADGTPVTSTDELPEAIFASQGDAESWLGEYWRTLLTAGVDQVTLREDTRTEYGPMNLHPADLLQDQNGLLSRPTVPLRASRPTPITRKIPAWRKKNGRETTGKAPWSAYFPR
jgi:hypothetical protein